MHLHTIVKVKADSEEEALDRVRSLLTNDGEYSQMAPFDWFDEDATEISNEIKDEKAFSDLRSDELREAEANLELARKAKEHSWEQGYRYQLAGEGIRTDNFWSTERIAYEIDWEDGKNTYYVFTDRHF